MKEIKNTKNCQIKTLCERLEEIDRLKKELEKEEKAIKQEIISRNETDFDYDGNGFTVTKRNGKSVSWKTEELKAFFGDAYEDYQKITITNIVKVNRKKSK